MAFGPERPTADIEAQMWDRRRDYWQQQNAKAERRYMERRQAREAARQAARQAAETPRVVAAPELEANTRPIRPSAPGSGRSGDRRRRPRIEVAEREMLASQGHYIVQSGSDGTPQRHVGVHEQPSKKARFWICKPQLNAHETRLPHRRVRVMVRVGDDVGIQTI